jgi:hypothetical protein
MRPRQLLALRAIDNLNQVRAWVMSVWRPQFGRGLGRAQRGSALDPITCDILML